jgi:hypothetical protein
MAAHAAPLLPFLHVSTRSECLLRRGLAQTREFAIIRDLLERWMSGLSRTPGKRV